MAETVSLGSKGWAEALRRPEIDSVRSSLGKTGVHMAKGNIQEEIDNFVQKLEGAKVPQEVPGLTGTSKKPVKVKPEDKAALNHAPVTEPKETTDEAIAVAEPFDQATDSLEAIEKTANLATEGEEIPFNPEENAVYYHEFLKQLVNIVSVLDETKVGQPPDQPISLYKIKGEWKAVVVPQKEEPKLLPPGIVKEDQPGHSVLTSPVKVSSPGDNKELVPPTFIPLPTGNITITKFIWTVPAEIGTSTDCTVVVGYGHEKYMIIGTFKSIGEAMPFPIDKGGVLKVSLMTKMPVDTWLELELEIEEEDVIISQFQNIMQPFMTMGPVEKALPIPVQVLPQEPETNSANIEKLLAEVTNAKKELQSNYDELKCIVEKNLGVDNFALGVQGAKSKPDGKKQKEVKGVDDFPLIVTVPLEDAIAFYTIQGNDYHYKYAKGVLMSKKESWKGGALIMLLKWAKKHPSKAKEIEVHFKNGEIMTLVELCLEGAELLKEAATEK